MDRSAALFSPKLQDKRSVAESLFNGLKTYFGFSGISIYILDPSTSEVNDIYPEETTRPLPKQEKDWLVSRYKEMMIHMKLNAVEYLYVHDRSQFLHTDKTVLAEDVAYYDYPCRDELYLVMMSEDEFVLGIVCLNNWVNKTPVMMSDAELESLLKGVQAMVIEHVQALDTLLIHEKIEGLLSDKQELKQRIQKDEDDLRRRILELSVLYDTSNSLGYSLDYRQIISLGMDALHKVLNYEVCAIFLIDFIEEGEVITRVNKPIPDEMIRSIQDTVVSMAMPFLKRPYDLKKVRRTTEVNFTSSLRYSSTNGMNSHANVPLVFKEDIIGMLNISATAKSVFTRSEITFLHTMANQLSSHLGRLKTVKRLEKSKISSLIKSMTEGVIMFDENQSLEIINPMALQLLEMPEEETVSSEEVIAKIQDVGLGPFYDNALMSRSTIQTKEVMIKNRAISVKASPVFDVDAQQIGLVFIFRDFTQLQNMNRLKGQRLEVISKVNLILKSISDLDNLLTVLIEFILALANADMGSIQLKQERSYEGRGYQTIVHSNFPDKIRRSYRFKSGRTISEYVAQTKELYFIDDYRASEKMNQNTKVLLESYICIPILVKQSLLGIINIARRPNPELPPISLDDLETLSMVTELSGTAIYNSVLYQETIKKQRIEQELKVANDIQTKLLPAQVPTLLNVDFGALTIPAREVGGDFYDFLPLANGHLGIVVADIVGKGVPAGLFMALFKSIVHTHLLNVTSPKEALTIINRILFFDPVNDRFIPIFYAILDPDQMTLKYCNAGHEPAILCSDGEFKSLDTPGLPLGAVEEAGYEENQIQLQDGELVLFFTDGVVEARNEQGELFTLSRVKEIALSHRHLTCSLLNQTIVEQLRQFCGKREQQDDITLVSMRAEFNRQLPEDEKPLKIKKICVLSAKKNIKRIRKEVDVVASEMGFPPADIFNLKLAINEAHANVIEHAYFGKEDGEIVFRFLVFKDRLTIVVRDFGPGIGQRTTKGEEEHLDELEGSGLGVFLIKTVMDEVDYNRVPKVGTELILTKYLPNPSPEAEASNAKE